jgi:Tol biopolymer transport system component
MLFDSRSREWRELVHGTALRPARWSRDSKKIAFDAFQSGQLLKDFVISAEGGNPEPVFVEPLSQGRPEWMPGGGDSLIYSRASGAPNPAFFILNPRSGQSEKVAGTDGLYEPLWSPNGRYLAAVDTAANDSLLLLDLKTGKRTQIAGQAWWPAWSADSQYIYFTKFGVNWIFRVRVPDGQEEKFLEVPFRVAPWPFTVAPDGSPILLRELGRYDVYSLALSFQDSEGR